jgi:hypothetical protein
MGQRVVSLLPDDQIDDGFLVVAGLAENENVGSNLIRLEPILG